MHRTGSPEHTTFKSYLRMRHGREGGIKTDSLLEQKLFAGAMSGTLGLLGLQERNHPQGSLLGREGGCVYVCVCVSVYVCV